MDFKIKSMGALCSLEIDCHINGIDVDQDDFVNQYDNAEDDAEEYGCGDMTCDIEDPTDEVLNKYKITAEEHKVLAEKISAELSFGSCGWCT